MKVLVCGGRMYDDRSCVFRILDALHAEKTITLVLHGVADGADMMADAWAFDRKVETLRFPAWRYASPIARNDAMLREGNPGLVIAFPGGSGTADMVARARAAGVRVIRVS